MFEIRRPKKDSTIYERAKRANSGIDEILELNTRQNESGEYDVSRILIQFPEVKESFSTDNKNVFVSYGYKTINRTSSNSESGKSSTPFNVITESSENGVNSFAFFGQRLAPKRESEESSDPESIKKYSPSAWLRMWFAEGQGLPKKYAIEAFPVKKKWKEGRGRIGNVPKTNMAVSWVKRTEKEDWLSEGGDYEDFPKTRQTFDEGDPDIKMKLNPVIGDAENGFLLKRKDEDLKRLSELRFFSSNTRTIYVPQLLFGKDTYEFNTEDASPVETDSFTAYVSTINKTYRPTKTRFYVTVEEKYKQKDFLGYRPTENVATEANYLPERSLTAKIEDVRTGLTMIPFDKKYSAVSFNGETHYIDVSLKNFFPKREYKIVFKYTDPKTEVEQLFDHSQTFKVTNET